MKDNMYLLIMSILTTQKSHILVYILSPTYPTQSFYLVGTVQLAVLKTF